MSKSKRDPRNTPEPTDQPSKLSDNRPAKPAPDNPDPTPFPETPAPKDPIIVDPDVPNPKWRQ